MEGILNQLIDPKVFEDFDALMEKMEKSVEATVKWLAELEKIEQSFGKTDTYKAYADMIERITKIEKELVKAQRERYKIGQDINKLMQEAAKESKVDAKAKKDIAQATENLNKATKEQAKIAKELSKIQKEQAKTAEKQAKSAKQNAEGNKKQAQATEALAEATQEQIEATKKLASEQAVVKEARRKEAAAMRLAAKEYLAAEGSLEKLVAQQALLIEKQNKVNLSTEAGKRQSDEYNAQILELKQQINAVREAQGNFTGSVGNYEKATVSARRELRDMIDALAEMRLQGKENTEAFRVLLAETTRLQDAFMDTSKQIKNMASDTLALDTIMGGMATAGGGFSAVTGAMRLFGGSTEQVAEAQKQLQAAIAITTGLTAIQKNLQQQSALMGAVSTFQAKMQAKAEAIRAAAIGKGNIALATATIKQKAFNLVAKANPYVLLAAALMSVVGALVLFSRRNREAALAQNELNREVENFTQITNESARSAANQLAVFARLQTQWRNLTDDYQSRLRFIEQNRREFDSLGFSIESVNDAENLLVRNSDAFVQSIIARARAQCH